MTGESREEARDEASQSPGELTSYHVRRARTGDEASLAWLIERLSPLLHASAEYRLGKTLRTLYDPEDIVNDVWVTALPRLHELPSRDERYTPVLLKFLTTTLVYRINNLVQKHIQGKPVRKRGEGDEDPLDEVAARTTGILRRMARKETQDLVRQCLDRLEPRDRELLILRGIEQHPYQEIAVILGADAKSLAVRYQRALEKLRREIPGSVYEELAGE